MDLIAGGKGDMGAMGPKNYIGRLVELGKTKDDIEEDIIRRGKPFRMYDDEGGLCYTGYYVPHHADVLEFEPLHCFGMPKGGCTEIHYKDPQSGTYVKKSLL